MYSRESDLLTQVEHNTLVLAREYNLQKEEIQRLTNERDSLRNEKDKNMAEIEELREQLSLVAYTLRNNPVAKQGLADLKQQIQEITTEVDACIALLQQGRK